jgi:hypothetical protein
MTMEKSDARRLTPVPSPGARAVAAPLATVRSAEPRATALALATVQRARSVTVAP